MTEMMLFVDMQWDASGELLAVLPRGQGFAMLWTATTKESVKLESGFKVRRCSAIKLSKHAVTSYAG